MGDSIKILDEEFIKSLQTIEDIHISQHFHFYKVSKPDGTIYILKVLNDTRDQVVKNFIKQSEMMAMLNHPNILKVYGIFYGNQTRNPSVLVEYCPDSIENAIISRNLTKIDISFAIYQISVAIKYIHKKFIIYHDLMPSKILIGQDSLIKISIFGHAGTSFYDDDSHGLGMSGLKFIAPELIDEKDDIDEKCDVYSFGTIMYFILFEGRLPRSSLRCVLSGNKARIPEIFSKLSREIIDVCWNFNPEDRPSFKDICQKIEKAHFGLFDFNSSEQAQISEMINSYKQKFF